VHLEAEVTSSRLAELRRFVDSDAWTLCVHIQQLIWNGAVKDVRVIAVTVENVVAWHVHFLICPLSPKHSNEGRCDGCHYHPKHVDQLLSEEELFSLLHHLLTYQHAASMQSVATSQDSSRM
jgi:hypothetical protein